ncbi:hypothetical protein HMSSN139_55620 [Paenibacillus sp. HMSSN-139]|nr:hypothetical protein HMSSN139_55620 [Paenibacillus sp. HMSSN-139]
MLGYLFSSEGSPGRIGSTDLSTTGVTVVDIEFKDGVATIPFIFFSDGKQILSFRLNETNVIGIVQVDVQLDLDQPADQETEEKSTEEQPIMEPIVEQPTKTSPFDENLVTDNSPYDIQLQLYQLPTYIK